MYFTKLKKKIEKYFFDRPKKMFRNFRIFSTNYRFSEIVEKSRKFRDIFFGRSKKYFLKTFFQLFLSFVKYTNIAFQQAIGRLLTPSNHREQAIWVPRPPKLHFTTPQYFNFATSMSRIAFEKSTYNRFWQLLGFEITLWNIPGKVNIL